MDALHARIEELLTRADRALAAAERPRELDDVRLLGDELASAGGALAARLRDAAGPPEELAALVAVLRRVGTLQRRLEDRIGDARFGALARIHDALARLRELRTVEALLPAAAEELARCCGFDRTVLSRRRGASWQAESLWMAPHLDHGLRTTTAAYVTGTWLPQRPTALEQDLIRRRRADLVLAGDPRASDELLVVTRSRGYVAAPVMPTGRVIGFLHADAVGREPTLADRDDLWTFAEGLGLVVEHVALLQRIRDQRARVLRAFGAAERALTDLSSGDTVLEGRGPVPLDPAPRGSAAPLVEQLLSRREREVVELMAAGARNGEIAERLLVSEATVKSHVRSLSRKLRASSRADAVSRYLRLRSGVAA